MNIFFFEIFVRSLLKFISEYNELKLGYEKFPPIFPLFTELFYKIFGNQDWAYYFLSQLFVGTCFAVVFKF